VVKAAEKEKVCTFATAFERESRWRWQTEWSFRLRKIVPIAAPSILPCRIARERERISRTPSENLPKIFSKKLSKKFGGYEKTPYLCKRFPAETGAW